MTPTFFTTPRAEVILVPALEARHPRVGIQGISGSGILSLGYVAVVVDRGLGSEGGNLERRKDLGPAVVVGNREVDAEAHDRLPAVALGGRENSGLGRAGEGLVEIVLGGGSEHDVPVADGQGGLHLLLLLVGIAGARRTREVHHRSPVIKELALVEGIGLDVSLELGEVDENGLVSVGQGESAEEGKCKHDYHCLLSHAITPFIAHMPVTHYLIRKYTLP
jgi:hypothetical protein